MNIQFRDGLLFASINMIYKGKTKLIDNVVIDTGAAETIISPDIVDDIGVYAEPHDKIVSFYGVGGSVHNSFIKTIDEIKIGNYKINNMEVDFGIIDTNGEINGLIGLDILINSRAVIDLKNLEIKFNE